jgi:uncharacterized protein YjcR
MHGGTRGSGAQHGNTNALKHGFTTREAKLQRAEICESIKQIKLELKDELNQEIENFISSLCRTGKK